MMKFYDNFQDSIFDSISKEFEGNFGKYKSHIFKSAITSEVQINHGIRIRDTWFADINVKLPDGKNEFNFYLNRPKATRLDSICNIFQSLISDKRLICNMIKGDIQPMGIQTKSNEIDIYFGNYLIDIESGRLGVYIFLEKASVMDPNTGGRLSVNEERLIKDRQRIFIKLKKTIKDPNSFVNSDLGLLLIDGSRKLRVKLDPKAEYIDAQNYNFAKIDLNDSIEVQYDIDDFDDKTLEKCVFELKI